MKTILRLTALIAGCSLFMGNAFAAVGDYYNALSQVYSKDYETSSASALTTGWPEGFEVMSGTSFTCQEALLETSSNYVPKVDIGKGESWTLTAHYDLNDGVAFNLVNFKTTIAPYDAEGKLFKDHETPRTATFAIEIRDKETDALLASGARSITFAIDTAYLQGLGCSFDPQDDTLSIFNDGYIDRDFYVTITASNPNGNAGSETVFYGIQSTNLAVVQAEVRPTDAPSQAVPEPATATLSLLALAGLAARRRRR